MSAKIFLVAIGLVAINVVSTAPSGCPAVDGPNSVYFPDEDCTIFWQCSNGKPYKFDCPANLHFNPKLNVCDWPQNAGCEGGKSDDTPTAAPPKSSEDDSSSSGSSNESKGEDDGSCDNSRCPAVDSLDSVYFPHKDCTKFCQCSNGVAYRHDCPEGLHFNSKLNVCDWPVNAGCSGDNVTSAPPKSSEEDDSSNSSSTSEEGSSETWDSSRCPAVDGQDSVYFPHKDCTKFCQCSNGVAYRHDCPEGLHFNSKLNVCDWPVNAGCDSSDDSSSSKSSSSEENATVPPAPTSAPPKSSEEEEPACDSSRCSSDDCPLSVYFPQKDCTKFCQCSNGEALSHDCPEGLHFNPKLNVCDWPANAGCESSDDSSSDSSSSSEENTTKAPAPPKSSEEDDSSSSNSSEGSSETCDSSKCPAVDGPDSVYFPHKDCTKFCQCSNGVAYQHNCPAGLHFNPELNVCDWPVDAGCKSDGSSDSDSNSSSGENITASPPKSSEENDSSSSNSSGSNDGDDGASGTCDSSRCPAVDGPDSVYFPHQDCTKFCQCSNGVAYRHDCPEGLHFNPIKNVCDWQNDAGCTGDK